jgi:cell division protein ZapA
LGDITRVTVAIYGEDYPLRSDQSEEMVQALGRMVDNRMRALAGRHPRVPQGRLAVLTALTLAEELMKLRAEHEETVNALQARWRRESKGSGTR